MPEEVLRSIYFKIKKEWKIAFLSAFIAGLITHLYVLTNFLPNHDGINNLYDDQDRSYSGRFF